MPDLKVIYPKGELRRSGYGHSNKYEEAFGATGWNPAETLVIEDSRSGVSKAKAAADDVRVIGTVAQNFMKIKSVRRTLSRMAQVWLFQTFWTFRTL